MDLSIWALPRQPVSVRGRRVFLCLARFCMTMRSAREKRWEWLSRWCGRQAGVMDEVTSPWWAVRLMRLLDSRSRSRSRSRALTHSSAGCYS